MSKSRSSTCRLAQLKTPGVVVILVLSAPVSDPGRKAHCREAKSDAIGAHGCKHQRKPISHGTAQGQTDQQDDTEEPVGAIIPDAIGDHTITGLPRHQSDTRNRDGQRCHRRLITEGVEMNREVAVSDARESTQQQRTADANIPGKVRFLHVPISFSVCFLLTTATHFSTG